MASKKRSAKVRYDPDPLFKAAAFSAGLKPPTFSNQPPAEDEITQEHLAELLGVSSRTIPRWNEDGMQASAVDKACSALGRHPAEINSYRVWVSGASSPQTPS